MSTKKANRRFYPLKTVKPRRLAHTVFMKKALLPLLLVTLLLPLSLPRAAAEEDPREDSRVVVCAMYHGVLKSRQGEYIVSPSRLEEDLKNFRAAGYSFVLPCQVAAYAAGGGELPEKPLILSFDDGHYNNLYYALPLLEKYDACALFNVIGAFSEFSFTSGDDDNPNYSHLTWENLRELLKSGRAEIGNHSWAMHAYSPRFGVGKLSSESESEYEKALFSDFSRLHERVRKECGYVMTSFAYPFGKYTKNAEQVLKNMGYTVTFSCNEGASRVKKGDKDSSRLLRRINMDGRLSSLELIKKTERLFEKAKAA